MTENALLRQNTMEFGQKLFFAAQKGNKQTGAQAHAQSNDNYYRIAGNTGEQKGKKHKITCFLRKNRRIARIFSKCAAAVGIL